jgi:hypothetical protein
MKTIRISNTAHASWDGQIFFINPVKSNQKDLITEVIEIYEAQLEGKDDNYNK